MAKHQTVIRDVVTPPSCFVWDGVRVARSDTCIDVINEGTSNLEQNDDKEAMPDLMSRACIAIKKLIDGSDTPPDLSTFSNSRMLSLPRADAYIAGNLAGMRHVQPRSHIPRWMASRFGAAFHDDGSFCAAGMCVPQSGNHSDTMRAWVQKVIENLENA